MDELRRMSRPVTRVIAACQACGHQAVVALPQGARLRCVKCGERDPEIEPAGQKPPKRPILMGFS
jgi:ribosomal protein S27AE